MRLCKVKGVNAIFHKWGEMSEVIPPSPMVGGHRGGEIKHFDAIVEFENGQVSTVYPSDIIFLDTEQVMRELQQALNQSITEKLTENVAKAYSNGAT